MSACSRDQRLQCNPPGQLLLSRLHSVKMLVFATQSGFVLVRVWQHSGKATSWKQNFLSNKKILFLTRNKKTSCSRRSLTLKSAKTCKYFNKILEFAFNITIAQMFRREKVTMEFGQDPILTSILPFNFPWDDVMVKKHDAVSHRLKEFHLFCFIVFQLLTFSNPRFLMTL